MLPKENHLRLCAFFHVVLSLYSHFSMKFNRGYVNLLNYFFVRLRVYQTPEYISSGSSTYSLSTRELFNTQISVDFIYWFACNRKSMMMWSMKIEYKVIFYIKFVTIRVHCIDMTCKGYRRNYTGIHDIRGLNIYLTEPSRTWVFLFLSWQFKLLNPFAWMAVRDALGENKSTLILFRLMLPP